MPTVAPLDSESLHPMPFMQARKTSFARSHLGLAFVAQALGQHRVFAVTRLRVVPNMYGMSVPPLESDDRDIVANLVRGAGGLAEYVAFRIIVNKLETFE